jgi:prepilin-type N-terminal cleavage/methylation domain-containing protein
MQRRRDNGFTLVELLVAVGIIAVLIGLLLPATLRALRGNDKARIQFQLQAIGLALNAYKLDFGRVPDSNMRYGNQAANGGFAKVGGVMMTRWLVGVQSAAVDGLDGPGYTVPNRDGSVRTVPAYLNPQSFRVEPSANTSSTSATWSSQPNECWLGLRDVVGNPIYYFSLRNSQSTPSTSYFDANDLAMFNTEDNNEMLPTPNADSGGFTTNLRWLAGDLNANNRIDGSETARVTGDYLLLTAGSARRFPKVDSANDAVNRSEFRASTQVSSIPGE